MVVDFKSSLDAAFSDDVELIIGELGNRFKGFSYVLSQTPLKRTCDNCLANPCLKQKKLIFTL